MKSMFNRPTRHRHRWAVVPAAAIVLALLTAAEAGAHGNGKPSEAEKEKAKTSAEYGAANSAAVVAEMLGYPDAMGWGVPDVHALKAALSNATGMTWFDRHNISPNAKVLYPNGVVSTISFNVAISGNLNEGPYDPDAPFFKGAGDLLEETDPGLPPWEHSKAVGKHEGTVSVHRIYFVDDVPAASAALAAQGLPLWTTAYTGPGQTEPFYYALHRGPGAMNGMRIEVIDKGMSCAFIENRSAACPR